MTHVAKVSEGMEVFVLDSPVSWYTVPIARSIVPVMMLMHHGRRDVEGREDRLSKLSKGRYWKNCQKTDR